MKDNLDFIQKNGIAGFVQDQYKKHACPQCGDVISIHNKKCFKCDTITKLIDKNA